MKRLMLAALAGLFLSSTPGLCEANGTPEGLIAQLLGSERVARAGLGSGRISRLASVAPAATPDGLHSEGWIRSRPVANGGEQWQCLTEALYFEARGESAEGLFAVAAYTSKENV